MNCTITRPEPDWRITCFYIDSKHRGQGIAREALGGAVGKHARTVDEAIEALS